MQIVKNWLSGTRNYLVGITLYKRLGKDQVLKDLFAKGETPHSKKRLAEELEALLSPAANAHPVAQMRPGKAHFIPQDHKVLVALKKEYLPWYQKMNMLRHELRQYKGNTPELIAIRKPIVFKILELEQYCMKVWRKMDYYREHGRLPDVEQEDVVIPTEPVALGKFIENVKKNIRRNRKLMMDNPDKAQYAQFYEDYKALYKKATGNDYIEKN